MPWETITAPPFSLWDAQSAVAKCRTHPLPGFTEPGPKPDKYVVWTTHSSLGNALNVFAAIFLYALVSGRQIIAGGGRVPELFCGPTGAFACNAFLGPCVDP